LQAEGFVQGSVERKDKRKYLSDGAIEVTVVLNLNGGFLALMISLPQEEKEGEPEIPGQPEPEFLPAGPEKGEILSERMKGKEGKHRVTEKPLPELPPVPLSKGEPLPPKALGEPKPGPIEELSLRPVLADLPKFTGLIVDARGLNMRAALIPKILDENGQELYPGQFVLPDKAARNGFALYAKDLTAAQTHPRVGRKPLSVKGWKLSPNGPSHIMLNAADARRVAPFTQKGTFLEECRVMIILD